jgi:hypothetical protein
VLVETSVQVLIGTRVYTVHLVQEHGKVYGTWTQSEKRCFTWRRNSVHAALAEMRRAAVAMGDVEIRGKR